MTAAMAALPAPEREIAVAMNILPMHFVAQKLRNAINRGVSVNRATNAFTMDSLNQMREMLRFSLEREPDADAAELLAAADEALDSIDRANPDVDQLLKAAALLVEAFEVAAEKLKQAYDAEQEKKRNPPAPLGAVRPM
jgi:hypothetical protein